MGYDTSFHPVDLKLIQERILPYVAGQGHLDDLVEQAVTRARVRFRANAWGLGCQFPGRDPFLHVWGRPYFIVGDQTSTDVDRWNAVQDEAEADRLAGEMLARVGAVGQPDSGGSLPSDSDLAAGFIEHLDALRACYRAVVAGTAWIDAQGKTRDPFAILRNDLAYAVLMFASQLRPGWMDRGFWPSQIFAKEFSPHTPLLGDLPEQLPQVGFRAASCIEANYSVGGWLPADKVPWMRERISELKEPIVEQTGVDATSLDKLVEALADAERRGLPFCEASEVYSGATGIMN